jgi:tetratricopeptide (TPR) repeat protein
MYQSFISFKEGNIPEAQKAAAKIDSVKPESFWYQFIYAWDLHRPDLIAELAKKYEGDFIIGARIPILSFSLNPIKDDMAFNFKFDGTGADIAGMLLYPMYIEPDEIYPLLVLGYRLLREREGDAALVQLEKSLVYSNGVRLNNEGVSYLLEFNYKAALDKFTQAEQILTDDPFLQYNKGLSYLMLGSFRNAETAFSKAIRLNRYLVPAYVGEGIALARQNRNTVAEALFMEALDIAAEYEMLPNKTIVLPMITKAKYLAQIALNDMDGVIKSASAETVKDNFVDTAAAVANFYLTKEMLFIDNISARGIFHSKELAYLLNLLNMPTEDMTESASIDRNTLFAAKYITVSRKKTFDEKLIEEYMGESSVLTELVNFAILSDNREAGLRYLQQLNYNDYRYVLQYKSSMYYYLWIRGFINVAASSATLEDASYYDQAVHYYRMLYYLFTGNANRFSDQVVDYAKRYPGEYRGRVMAAMKNLLDRDTNAFLNNITALLKEEPYVFNKVSLERGLERY